MRVLILEPPTGAPIHQTDRRFLSIAVDWALILGERWWDGTRRTRAGFGNVRAPRIDLSDERIIKAAAALSPAYLRVGGSESDRMSFEPDDGELESSGGGAKQACPTLLTGARWNEVADFAEASNLDLFVCVGAGACARDHAGRWTPESFQRFLYHVVKRGQKVPIWELGNEVNGFPFIHGPSARVSPKQYAKDFELFRAHLREQMPDSRAAGPAAAVWPVIGEPVPMARRVAKRLGPHLDMLTWHYYPYQSRRGVIGTRRVRPRTALRPRARRSARRLAGRMRRFSRENGVPAVWLSETGQALFGGQAGVSDRLIGSLWWLDHLGNMANSGVDGVVRQALVGGEYGLLSQVGAHPRPDFWATLIWKISMGSSVYESLEAGKSLQAYRHSSPDQEGGWSAVITNRSRRKRALIRLPEACRGWLLDGPPDGFRVRLNGTFLGPEDVPSRESLPQMAEFSGEVVLPPVSALVVRFV